MGWSGVGGGVSSQPVTSLVLGPRGNPDLIIPGPSGLLMGHLGTSPRVCVCMQGQGFQNPPAVLLTHTS